MRISRTVRWAIYYYTLLTPLAFLAMCGPSTLLRDDAGASDAADAADARACVPPGVSCSDELPCCLPGQACVRFDADPSHGSCQP